MRLHSLRTPRAFRSFVLCVSYVSRVSRVLRVSPMIVTCVQNENLEIGSNITQPGCECVCSCVIRDGVCISPCKCGSFSFFSPFPPSLLLDGHTYLWYISPWPWPLPNQCLNPSGSPCRVNPSTLQLLYYGIPKDSFQESSDKALSPD